MSHIFPVPQTDCFMSNFVFLEFNTYSHVNLHFSYSELWWKSEFHGQEHPGANPLLLLCPNLSFSYIL